MAKVQVGDRVRIKSKPVNWPACTEFTLLGAEGTASLWVDWPEAMDPYREFIYVRMDQVNGAGKVDQGAYMIFHKHTLEKI